MRWSVLLVLICSFLPATAGQLPLCWSRVPLPYVDGYNLYWGIETVDEDSQFVFVSNMDCGPDPEVCCHDLLVPDCVEIHTSVKTYASDPLATCGPEGDQPCPNESGWPQQDGANNVIKGWATPVITTPTFGQQSGFTGAVGSNFRAGLEVRVDNQLVAPDAVSCSSFAIPQTPGLTLAVRNLAELGPNGAPGTSWTFQIVPPADVWRIDLRQP